MSRFTALGLHRWPIHPGQDQLCSVTGSFTPPSPSMPRGRYLEADLDDVQGTDKDPTDQARCWSCYGRFHGGDALGLRVIADHACLASPQPGRGTRAPVSPPPAERLLPTPRDYGLTALSSQTTPPSPPKFPSPQRPTAAPHPKPLPHPEGHTDTPPRAPQPHPTAASPLPTGPSAPRQAPVGGIKSQTPGGAGGAPRPRAAVRGHGRLTLPPAPPRRTAPARRGGALGNVVPPPRPGERRVRNGGLGPEPFVLLKTTPAQGSPHSRSSRAAGSGGWQ